MKTLALSFVTLCLLTFLAVTFFSTKHEPAEFTDEMLLDLSQPPVLAQPETTNAAIEIPLLTMIPHSETSVAEQMEVLLTDAHVGSDNYLLLMQLLDSNEAETLAYLALLRYPEDMAVESAEYAEVEMISRAMLEFYGAKPLRNNLETVEQLRQTGPLFNNVVSDLFLAGTGADSANVAYDWIMQNPEHPASLRSGATIGTIMKDFTPDQAWGKANTLPAGPIRARAFTAIIAEGTDGDINAAIELINSAEVTADLDGALSNVLRQGIDSGYDYSELVDIAAAPVNPVYRSSSLTVLFQNWIMDQPEGLIEWSKQDHAFPAEQMAEINLIMKQTLERHQVEF